MNEAYGESDQKFSKSQFYQEAIEEHESSQELEYGGHHASYKELKSNSSDQ